MALQKTKKLSSGFEISYWKITELYINYSNNTAQVVLSGYKDKASRTSGSTPVEHLRYEFSRDTFPFAISVLDEEGNNAVKLAYSRVKDSQLNDIGVETNFLVDSIDC